MASSRGSGIFVPLVQKSSPPTTAANQGRSIMAPGPYVVTSWLWRSDETVISDLPLSFLALIHPVGESNRRGRTATFGSTSRIDRGALNCCSAWAEAGQLGVEHLVQQFADRRPVSDLRASYLRWTRSRPSSSANR